MVEYSCLSLHRIFCCFRLADRSATSARWAIGSRRLSVHALNKAAANSPVKPRAPAGPARIVLAVHDEPARGRKPVLRDELAAVVTIRQYPRERLPFALFKRHSPGYRVQYLDNEYPSVVPRPARKTVFKLDYRQLYLIR